MTIRLQTFPRTTEPPPFVNEVAAVFAAVEVTIGTAAGPTFLKSNEVLAAVAPGLSNLGFEIEHYGRTGQLRRPVLFGENGTPEKTYQIDAFHPGIGCGIEIEAGRAVLGGAIYRDFVQALVMVDVRHLVIAVPQIYRHSPKDGTYDENRAYEFARAVFESVYGHQRLQLPFGLTVIGY